MSDEKNTGKKNGQSRPAGEGRRSVGGRPGAVHQGKPRPAYAPRRPAGENPRPADGAHRPTDGAHRPTGNGPRPAYPPRRPAGESTRPADGAHRPADGAHRPTGNGPRPAYPPRRPAGESTRPADGARRPTDGAHRPTGNGPRPAYPPRRPAGESTRPADGAHRPTGNGPRPAYAPRRPAGENPRPADGAHRPTDGARRPTGNGPRPAYAPRRPAGPYGRPADTETTGLSQSARRLALTVLQDVHENGAYAALSLNEHLPRGTMKPEDRRLVTGIVYGTLENQIKIDYVLDRLMEHPTREPAQRDILRMSAYQILFLDRVPDSAAVNEGVKLVKALGMESASGFINAVLRNLARGKDAIEWPDKEKDGRLWLHVMSSTPLWLVDKLTEAYGWEEAENLLMYRENTHPVVVRPNMTRLTDEQFETLLREKNLSFEKGVAPHAYLLNGVSELGFDSDYQSGKFSIQGQSSLLAAEAVQAKPGMKILDACAAPGGKSAYLCEAMEMTGRVYAWELHEKRAMLLDGVKRRLRLENLRISVRDATDFKEDLTASLDAVLLDAPCSGTGVMAQKPDIKLRLQESDVAPIVENQSKLLHTLCRYVKPGGVLVYSTCSVLPEENKRQIAAFLEAHADFSVEPLPTTFPASLRQQQDDLGLQLLGYRDGVEGFYIVRLRRMR